jgi:hypothetical protein
MAQVPSAAQSRNTGLYTWLADREQRAVTAGGKLTDPTTGAAYDGSPRRLAALRAGEPVEVHASALPPWARVGVTVRWWTRAVVRPDGTVTFRDDDGSLWLAENGL